MRSMKHEARIFSITELKKEDELVEAMTAHTWPLCYSFHYGNLLYLSDGDQEDSPEYAVVTIDKVEGHHGVIGREVGRVMPKEMNAVQVRKIVQERGQGHYSLGNQVKVQAEPAWHHTCDCCRMDEE